jgi:hypothetical protein
MARNEMQSRRMYLLVTVMSLLLIYTFVMTSTNVSSPHSHLERHVEVPLPPSYSPEEVPQQEWMLIQNQTGESEISEVTRNYSSSFFNETVNISITTKPTRIPEKNESEIEHEETSTTQPTMVKVKDLYEAGFSHPKPELCLMDGIDVQLLILIISAPSHFNHRSKG